MLTSIDWSLMPNSPRLAASTKSSPAIKDKDGFKGQNHAQFFENFSKHVKSIKNSYGRIRIG